jgi:hypothetical protein
VRVLLEKDAWCIFYGSSVYSLFLSVLDIILLNTETCSNTGEIAGVFGKF